MKTNESAAVAAKTSTTGNAGNVPVMKVTKGTAGEQAPTTQVQEQKKELTLQELKERATLVYMLQDKHSKLLEKKALLERFAIGHEEGRAEARVLDAAGVEFRSNSPKTISKLIEFWKEEFNAAIADVEAELKKKFDLSL